MKQRIDQSMPTIGGTSLLVIFGVLCLVVFSLLSLNTVLAEQRISEAYARQTEQWYAADLQAQEIFARLRTGETVPGVEKEETMYRYVVPVSEHQTLQVTLRETEGRWEICSWRAIAHPEEEERNLPVWSGLDEEE